MRKLLGFSLILIILLLAFSQPAKSVKAEADEEDNYLLKSTVEYVNPTSTHIWNFTEREEDRVIGLFMNNSWQTVRLLNSTFSVETFKSDSDKNSVAVLQFPKSELSPGENLSFVVWYQITTKSRTIPNIAENMSDELQMIEPTLVTDYTAEEGPWQTSNLALRQLAFTLKGGETKVLSIVDDFISWIVNNIVYPKTSHEVPYYPSETYSKLEGDCDDQAMLLITLCRIVGIPAYLQVGCIYLPNRLKEEDLYWDNRVTLVQKRIGWHGWAMVYVPPWGWLPVDLTYVSQSPEDDSSNAIKHGAITQPTAVQFENVMHDDYVASSLEARSFLIQNGFEVFAEDEMLLGRGEESSALTIPPLNWVPIVFAVVIVFLISVSLFVVRKRVKR